MADTNRTRVPLIKRCPVCGYRYESILENCLVDEAPLGRERPGVDLLGPYRLVERLGTGGMGAVYRAVHVKAGRGVALKLLHKSLRLETVATSRFFHEARAVNTIRHPNVIEVYDLNTEGDELFMVLELLKGADLRGVLDGLPERRLPPLRAVYLLEQICGALQAAHEHNIIHRDLKPENIFITAREGKPDFVKLLDFGVAKLERPEGRLTREGVTLGTPEYMAPEQARGHAIDGRTDLYAVGCMAYEMLTGRPVFVGDSPGDVMVKQVSEAPAPLRARVADIPEKLEAVILRCLAKDPRSRPQSGLDLAQELAAAMGVEFDTSGAFLSWKNWDGYSGVSSITSLPEMKGQVASSASLRRATSTAKRALRRHGKVAMFAALAVLLFAVGGLAGLRRAPARSGQAAPQVAAAAGTPRVEAFAQVLLQSNPAGVSVVDLGRERAPLGTTPTTLARVPMGRGMWLRFEKPGWKPVERRVVVDAERVTVAVALEPDAQTTATAARTPAGPARGERRAARRPSVAAKRLDSRGDTINPF